MLPEDERIEAQVGAALRFKGWTICTAESCTGGLIAHRLTNIPGCSEYVVGGVVSYANEAKINLLGVPAATIASVGAVSEATARAMADGVRALFDADISVSVTGIAGPGGGSPEKPVGLTYIGVAVRGYETRVERFVWGSDREGNKALSADAALRMALEAIKL
ncbi:MAG: CinA family protein [Anaerolinea sp.]|nr:CinA family protein [Anaerolinea sp.]